MVTLQADAMQTRRQMQSLLESGQFSDVTLVVGKPGPEQKEFKVHRNLLSASSPVFNAMFSYTDTKEVLERRVVIENVSAEAMHHLLIFIYTGELKLEGGTKMTPLMELLIVINKYQVDSLKGECVAQLVRMINVVSVSFILSFADKFNVPTLKEHCINFIVNNSSLVISRNNRSWVHFKNIYMTPELKDDILYRLAAKGEPLLNKSMKPSVPTKRKHSADSPSR